MYNHLTSNKNKHNRSYLTRYYEIPNLTVDQIFNKSRQVFEEKKTENNNRMDVNIKQVSNRKQYSKARTTKLDGPHSEGTFQIWIIKPRPNSWDPNYTPGVDFLDHDFLSSKNSG
mgnify:CR=1 FL=1